MGQGSSEGPPSSPGQLPPQERQRGGQHLLQGVRLGPGAAVDQPRASISKSTSGNVLLGLPPGGMSQPGFFFKSGSHFLPTFLTSGSLPGTFPELSGLCHGHVSCLCSKHSQPGHWASHRCQVEPAGTAARAFPSPGPTGSNWRSNSHLCSNSMTPSLEKKKNSSSKTNKSPRMVTPGELAVPPLHFRFCSGLLFGTAKHLEKPLNPLVFTDG